MKIVTWNCNGAFRKKYHAIENMQADILVIQECEDPACSTNKYVDWAGEYLWKGENKNRGIGIFSRNGLQKCYFKTYGIVGVHHADAF